MDPEQSSRAQPSQAMRPAHPPSAPAASPTGAAPSPPAAGLLGCICWAGMHDPWRAWTEITGFLRRCHSKPPAVGRTVDVGARATGRANCREAAVVAVGARRLAVPQWLSACGEASRRTSRVIPRARPMQSACPLSEGTRFGWAERKDSNFRRPLARHDHCAVPRAPRLLCSRKDTARGRPKRGPWNLSGRISSQLSHNMNRQAEMAFRDVWAGGPCALLRGGFALPAGIRDRPFGAGTQACAVAWPGDFAL